MEELPDLIVDAIVDFEYEIADLIHDSISNYIEEKLGIALKDGGYKFKKDEITVEIVIMLVAILVGSVSIIYTYCLPDSIHNSIIIIAGWLISYTLALICTVRLILFMKILFKLDKKKQSIKNNVGGTSEK
jgi:hypothetical protein